MKRSMRVKRILASILILAAVLSFGVTAWADEPAGTKVVGSAVFTNTRTDENGLSVTKKVTSAGDYSAPGATFSFTLNVNGEIAAGTVYKLFNAGGTEIKLFYNPDTKQYFNYTEDQFSKAKDKASLYPVDRKTDASGSFALRDGEMALFTGLRDNDAYSITEDAYTIDAGSTATGTFTQISPAAGTAAEGFLAQNQDDNKVVFENRYQEEPLPPPGQSKPATLIITKYVQTQNGFEQPDTSFTFSIVYKEYESDPGVMWNNSEYDVYDVSVTPAKFIETRTTNDSGEVTLKAYEQAVVSDFPANVEYIVTETNLAEGWTCVTDEALNGATASGGTYYLDFTNRNVSFGVSKSMSDYSTPDIYFNYTLTDQDSNPVSGANYYLYKNDSSGRSALVSETLKSTDSYGNFTLRPGQTAMFTKLPAGVTKFNVKENVLKGYKQTIPASPDGYTDLTESSSVVIYRFNNEVQEPSGKLIVRKSLATEITSPELANKEFTFVLLRGTAPQTQKTYSINGKTFKTDDNGQFKLKANEAAEFPMLIVGQEYTVKEVFTEAEAKNFIVQEGNPQSGKLNEDGLDFVFTNVYKSFIDLSITKVRQPDGLELPNVDFKLQRLNADGTDDIAFSARVITTDENGKCGIKELRSGTYRLEEVFNPYFVTRSFVFTLDLINNTISVDKVLDENGKEIDGGKATYVLNEAIVENADETHAELKVSNEPNDKLAFVIEKLDNKTGEPLEGAVYRISGKGIAAPGVDVTTNSSGIADVKGSILISGQTYTVEEITAPDGYTICAQPKRTITVDAKGVVTADTTIEVGTDDDKISVPALIYRNDPENIKLTVKKLWDNGDVVTDNTAVTAVLYGTVPTDTGTKYVVSKADGTLEYADTRTAFTDSMTLSADNEFAKEFSTLPKMAGGDEISWFVAELDNGTAVEAGETIVNAGAEYEVDYISGTEDGAAVLKIVNTLITRTVSIKKTVTGTYKPTEKDVYKFEVEVITDDNGTPVSFKLETVESQIAALEEATVDASGDKAVITLPYGQEVRFEVPATAVVKIKELAASASRSGHNVEISVSLDGADAVKADEVTVEATSDGMVEFTNKYSYRPGTGDDSNMRLWLILLAVSAAGTAAVVSFRKKHA